MLYKRPAPRIVGTGMPRPLDAWLVVGVSTAVNTLAWSVRSTFALYYVAILEELAWGRGRNRPRLLADLARGSWCSAPSRARWRTGGGRRWS